LTKLAGLLVILFGLHTTGLVRIPLLYREARFDPSFGASGPGSGQVPAPRRGSGPVGALFMGAAFAAGWTPCVGPFLATLLGLASQEQTVAQGMLLLFVYALGLGLPFVLAGVGTERALQVSRSLRPRLHAIEVMSGGLLIVMGLLLFSDRLSLLTSWLTQVFGIGLAQ